MRLGSSQYLRWCTDLENVVRCDTYSIAAVHFNHEAVWDTQSHAGRPNGRLSFAVPVDDGVMPHWPRVYKLGGRQWLKRNIEAFFIALEDDAFIPYDYNFRTRRGLVPRLQVLILDQTLEVVANSSWKEG